MSWKIVSTYEPKIILTNSPASPLVDQSDEGRGYTPPSSIRIPSAVLGELITSQGREYAWRGSLSHHRGGNMPGGRANR
eukprot:1194497-Prorocentrum_minimum.AAC.8